MATITATPTTCYPSWTPKYRDIIARGQTKLASGCATVDGNVQCKPEDMRAAAEAKLRAAGWWPADKPLSLEAYTLARNIQSEVGNTRLFEMVAVGEAAVNRARVEKKPSVLNILLYRQQAGHPNYGWYGPVHGPKGVISAPYKRWAATSADPTIAAVMVADLILSGGSGNFNNLADNQAGLQYVGAFATPEATLLRQALSGNYWVGHLPGVDPWRTTQYRHYGVSPISQSGLWLLRRSTAVFGADARTRVGDKWVPKEPRVWGDMPICAPGAVEETPIELPASPGALFGYLAIGSLALGGGVLLSKVLQRRAALASGA